MSNTITFQTPDGEAVNLRVDQAEAWIAEREWASNHGAADACRRALAEHKRTQQLWAQDARP